MKYLKPIRLLLLLCLFAVVAKSQEIVEKVPDTVKKIILTTYYAKKFEGRRTTSGERYRSSKFTAAHRTLPFGTIIKVKNLRTGKTVEVKVNDRGPFSKKFSLDISRAAAQALGIYKLGYARVEIAYVSK
ncbi:septal ring lytic transglycosylase RlpA family protein [Pedobacter sp.]